VVLNFDQGALAPSAILRYQGSGRRYFLTFASFVRLFLSFMTSSRLWRVPTVACRRLLPLAICGYCTAMQKIALVSIMLAAASGAPAQAQDSFVPRLLAAKHDYLQALEVCLRRVISASPTVTVKPEHIAKGAIKTCLKKDAAVRATRKRVYAFPSVDNFMAGTDDKIFDFSVGLATVHIASRESR
jgi:hypothetical protein